MCSAAKIYIIYLNKPIQLKPIITNFDAVVTIRFIFAFLMLFFCFAVQAQNDNIERILRQIEQYNQDLKAFGRLKQARYYDLMKEKSLSGLHIESNYLFLGKPDNAELSPNSRFNFFNLKVGQEFRLPRYYKSIDNKGKQMRLLLDAEEEEIRQNILLQAKQHCYTVVQINKKLRLNKIFWKETQRLVNAYDTLFLLGSASLLEQQKAHILALDLENENNQLLIEKQEALHELALLNGNQHIYLDDEIYEPNAFLLPIDLIQQQATTNDASYQKYEQNVLMGKEQTAFIKKQNLPILDLGYSLQFEDQWSAHGIYAGFSLPLWSNKRNVKAAELEVHYRQFLMSNEKQLIQREVFDLYNKISTIERYLNKYEQSLEKLKDYEKTLAIALELGEMTLQEYIQNILDYKDMHYKYLDMEYEYHHLKATLMRWYL